MNPIKEIRRYFSFIIAEGDAVDDGGGGCWPFVWALSFLALFLGVVMFLVMFPIQTLIIIGYSVLRFIWDYRGKLMELWDKFRNYKI